MVVICLIITNIYIGTESIYAEYIEYKLGCIPETQEELDEFYGSAKNDVGTKYILPSSVDLSTSPCFPPIGDQKSLGSCASYATTYYQYTYEVNKLNHVNSESDRVIYSPKWTYNFANNGYNSGTTLTNNYKVLMSLGCLKNNDFPYTGNSSDYIEWASGLEDEKIEALQTRITKINKYEIPVNSNISSPSSTALQGLKNVLNEGKIVVTSTRCYFNSKIVNNNCIAYRCTQNLLGNHALTIVGYDDNICCDVNENGIIEECEKGAFKVANSWGTQFNQYGISSNDGYFWVLYDSLNEFSTNTINNWEEKLNGTRYAIFSTSGNNNTFYTIEVDHINVNLIGEVKINTNDRESFKLFYGKYYGSDPVNWNSISLRIVDPFDGTGAPNIQYTGCILFDYDSVVKYLPSIEMGYKWLVSIIDTLNDTSDRFRLMDNKGNKITSFKSLSNMSNRFAAYHQLGLNK